MRCDRHSPGYMESAQQTAGPVVFLIAAIILPHIITITFQTSKFYVQASALRNWWQGSPPTPLSDLKG